MALQRDARYPGRWLAPSTAHPQGAFKNRTAPGSLDGSYIEQDWANDWDGYFSSLLISAGLTANGTVDAVGASQYFTALTTLTGGVQGTFKNMSASCTGTTAVVTFTADELVVKNSSNVYRTLRALSLSASTGAASGVANSLDTGSWAQSTWYARHVIYNPTTATAALLWSLSKTAPTLPTGYTFSAFTGWERTQATTNFNPLGMQWYGRRWSYVKGSTGNVPFLPVMALGNQGSPVVPTYVAIAWANYAPPDTYELDLMARTGTPTAQVICAPNSTYGKASDTNQTAPSIAYIAQGSSASPLSIRQMIPVESGNIYYASDDATYSLLQCCGGNIKG